MTNKQRIKKIQKENQRLRQQRFTLIGRMALRDNHIEELKGFIEMQEEHQVITENALEREWTIREYLEERNDKLVLAVHGVE